MLFGGINRNPENGYRVFTSRELKKILNIKLAPLLNLCGQIAAGDGIDGDISGF